MAFRIETEPLAKLPHCHAFAFSPDGKQIVGSPRSSAAKLFETKTWTKKLDFKKSGGHAAAAFSRDGKVVALAESHCYLGTYSVQKGEPICKWRISKEFHEVSGLIMSPTTPEVIYSCWHNRVSIFDVKTGKLTRELPVTDSRAGVMAISLSPSGHELAATVDIYGQKVRESSIVVWSWPEGRELRRVALRWSSSDDRRNASKTNDLHYASENLFAAVSGTGAVALFDAKSGKEKCKLRDAVDDSYAHLAVDSQGMYLACVDKGQLLVWDLATKKLLREMRVNETSSYRVGFSPNAELIAVAINQVYVWKTADIVAGEHDQEVSKQTSAGKRAAKQK